MIWPARWQTRRGDRVLLGSPKPAPAGRFLGQPLALVRARKGLISGRSSALATWCHDWRWGFGAMGN